ncbi:uncharacterized protein J5M81_009965 [Pluvialis apricaria]
MPRLQHSKKLGVAASKSCSQGKAVAVYLHCSARAGRTDGWKERRIPISIPVGESRNIRMRITSSNRSKTGAMSRQCNNQAIVDAKHRPTCVLRQKTVT